MDILIEGLLVAVIGMVTVFVALIGLVGVIVLMNKLLNKRSNKLGNKESKKEYHNKGIDTILKKEDSISNESMTVEEDAIAAVITAAIAASLNRSTHDVIVRSIKRIPNVSPAWNRISKQEQVLNIFNI